MSQDGQAPRFGKNHRWIILGVGVAAQASFSAAITGLPVTGTIMRSDYHLTNTSLGLAVGAIYLGIAVSEILWGLWTDKFGERRILLSGLLSTAAVLVLMAVLVTPHGRHVPSVPVLVGGMLLIGILGGSVNGSSGRAVMVWFREGQRGFAMSVRQTAMPAGGAVGTLLLPLIARSQGFRPVFVLLGGFCLLAAVATWCWMYSPADLDPQHSPAPAVSPLRRPEVWRLAFASGMLTMPQIAVLAFAGIYLHDKHQAALAIILGTLLVTQIGGGAARIWSGRYCDRHGNRRQLIRLIGVGAGLLLLLLAVFSSGPTLLVAALLALAGLLANAWHGVAYTEIASMAGASRAGTALGLESTAVFGAGFLTPLIIPCILGFSSWPVVWAVIGVVAVLALFASPAPQPARHPNLEQPDRAHPDPEHPDRALRTGR